MNGWINSGIQALVLLAAIIAAWYHLKGDVRSLREAQKVIADDVTEIKQKVNGDGFVKKGELSTLLRDADNTHDRHEKQLTDLWSEIRRLEQSKLSVSDYRKESRRR